jgi:hypothetical protein
MRSIFFEPRVFALKCHDGSPLNIQQRRAPMIYNEGRKEINRSRQDWQDEQDEEKN